MGNEDDQKPEPREPANKDWVKHDKIQKRKDDDGQSEQRNGLG